MSCPASRARANGVGVLHNTSARQHAAETASARRDRRVGASIHWAALSPPPGSSVLC